MRTVNIFGYDYNEVELKCGGHIYIEPFGEEEECCKIYDENMNYLDYIDVAYEEDFAHAHYNKELEYFKECEDLHNYLGAIFRSYTYGHSIEDLIDNICEDNVLYYTPEEIEEEKQQMLDFYEQYGEQQFCATYMINKIGNLYFYGEY